jgi:hypothetical protein
MHAQMPKGLSVRQIKDGAVRFTADLAANTLSFAMEVQEPAVKAVTAGDAESEAAAVVVYRIAAADWYMSVPNLRLCHIHAASGPTLKLTLLP